MNPRPGGPCWAAVNGALPKYSEFTSSIILDQGIHARLKKYAATAEAKALSGARVREFLASLEQGTREFYDAENAELFQFRRSLEGPNAPPPSLWDLSYYSEKLRKSRYDFDEEALMRPRGLVKK